MKTHFILTALVVSGMLLASCNNDLTDPIEIEPQPPVTFEEEYQLALRVETKISTSEYSERPGGGHILTLAGEGVAFSTTFGPMDAQTNLEFEVATGRVSGFMTFTPRNSRDKLQIRIADKSDLRRWGDLKGSCFPSASVEPFAEMNFNGTMCINHIAEDLSTLDKDDLLSVLISGELKEL